MLNIIYQDYLGNLYKIGKLIEQIALRIPLPLNNKNKLQISFDLNRFKEKITFPSFYLQFLCLNIYILIKQKILYL